MKPKLINNIDPSDRKRTNVSSNFNDLNEALSTDDDFDEDFQNACIKLSRARRFYEVEAKGNK